MSTTFSIPSNFATCPNCEKTCTSILWCVNCDIAYLVENFKNWSSGDPKLDDFIRHTQKTAKETMDFLEWIDFSQFDLIKYTGKEGSFSTIYTALWMEGPFWNWDEAASIWSRGGPTKVILKRLNDSRELSDQFINQCLNNNALADCFGVTRDNTSNIMFVFRYYNKGNIYSFLDSCNELLCWRDTVDLLWSIASGIHKIHEQGLMHGHLHGGNILVESERDIMDARVSDTGLHGPPFNTNSEDPLKRPSALDLYILFEKWVVAICDDPEPSEISDQFDRAEIAKFSDFKNYGLIPLSHKGAIYHSRNLNLI
ncbi:unnamed protein product [Rhizophagus irregularis]|nr:unnamed protein product [Rhizophagus irregularis]